jgi:hypothetical protein
MEALFIQTIEQLPEIKDIFIYSKKQKTIQK